MSIAREPDEPRIYTEDRPRRHAPVSEVGVIGWIRHNLFRTPFDIILTLVSFYFIYLTLASAITWIVRDANWFTITRNVSLFMLGPLVSDPEAVTRIQFMTLVLAFAVGVSFAAWAHIGRRSWIALAVIAAVAFVVPTLISRTIVLPPSVLAAGNGPIVSGSLSETPNSEFAFLAAGGDTFSARLADSEASDDAAITGIAAFTDRATDAIVNAARNRVTGLARLEFVKGRLADSNISDTERAQFQQEVEALTASTNVPVIDLYSINSTPVTVRLLAADGVTALAEGVLTPGSDPITFTFPETGWYVLQKSVEGAAVGLVEIRGMYPHLERQQNQVLHNANGEVVLGPNGQPREVTVDQYLRLIDDLQITAAPPAVGGTELPRYLFIDNKYRGDRPVKDFLVLHLGPFLEKLNRAFIPLLLLFFIGYQAAYVLDLLGPIVGDVSARVRQLAGEPAGPAAPRVGGILGAWWTFMYRWRWQFLVYVLFWVVFTLSGYDTVGKIMAAAISTGVVFTSLFMLRPIPDVRWSVRVVAWLWFVMPFIILFLVVGTDYGRWGGLFLTFMLTIVGIVGSFPIGVLLALGRRADGLPAIKYLCIAFIELVRGVPLITVLFLASLALPLVSPALQTVPQAIRAMVAITLFSAAYLAENVRGGLQSIPPGQAEAARALGMNPVQVTLFITLPQALRAVIPALVGQCIALFKDTSLVAIVGLLDLTKSADSVVAQAEYIGLRREAYLFISIVYFVFSYAMGYVSRKLEQSGSGRARQIKL